MLDANTEELVFYMNLLGLARNSLSNGLEAYQKRNSVTGCRLSFSGFMIMHIVRTLYMAIKSGVLSKKVDVSVSYDYLPVRPVRRNPVTQPLMAVLAGSTRPLYALAAS